MVFVFNTYLLLCVHPCVWVFACTFRCQGRPETWDSLELEGHTHDMGAANWTRNLCKTIKGSSLLSQLSRLQTATITFKSLSFTTINFNNFVYFRIWICISEYLYFAYFCSLICYFCRNQWFLRDLRYCLYYPFVSVWKIIGSLERIYSFCSIVYSHKRFLLFYFSIFSHPEIMLLDNI